MFVIVYFTPLLLFFHQTDAAVTALTSSPPNPSTAIETHELTLMWNYTLDGSVLLALFSNVTGGGSDEIARKPQGGSISVGNNYNDRFSAGVSDTHAWLKIVRVKRSDQGMYRITVTASGSGSFTDAVDVIVQYEPSVTIQHCPTSVTEGKNVTLSCNATGNPVPSFAWIRTSTREVLSAKNGHMITAIKKNESGSYECLASNGIGNNSTKSCTIDVQYQPKILNLPSVYNVTVQQSVTLLCQAEGNPAPSFAWTPCEDGCDESRLVIPEVLNDTVYKCTVTNYLGSDSATASVVIAGKEINVTMTITGKSCTNDTLLSNKLITEIDKVFVNEPAYNSTTLKNVRCGSLIVDLILKFNSIVSEKWVLNILKEATKNGKLGEFDVAASSIKGTRPVISTTTSPTGKTTPRSPDDTNIGLIVGCAVGGFILLVIIIAVVIWCVRKNSNKDKDKKKKSKTSNKEVSDNDAEGHRMAQFQGSHPTPGYGNNGYEDTGSTSRPPVANAGKKDKKGKKKQEQEPEKPVGVVYAQVDKSKRTSKPKEPENLYDQAERPNSKRPGELNYASPEDLHQGHSMPRNSAAQPKKPEAYTETQYAVLV